MAEDREESVTLDISNVERELISIAVGLANWMHGRGKVQYSPSSATPETAEFFKITGDDFRTIMALAIVAEEALVKAAKDGRGK